jgi:hypothetical protein
MQSQTTQDAAWVQDVRQAQATRTVNVVCMKWGTRYGPEWVNRLYGMVMRHTSWTVRFVCLTDDGDGIRPEVEIKPLPEVKFDPAIGKYWPKLGLMHKDLGGTDKPLRGMSLFLDLDLLIIDSLDPFFEADGRFLIIQEWKDPQLGFGNSSVVRWCIGQEANVLERFYATSADVIRDVYGYKEQNFLTKAVDEATFWPTDWCVPFSHACLPRNRVLRFFSTPTKPETGKILVFFGSITPESAMRGEHEVKKRVGQGFQVRLTQRRFRPAAWIADYWRA